MPLDTLTIFYTYGIRGQLAPLPRLYTFLQQLKREYDPRALIVDTGAACVPDVWHCEVTGGRSTVIVLDGMGYHAANVSGYLSERYELQRVTGMGLVDERHNWRYHVPPERDDSIIVAGVATPALTLCIVAAPADQTRTESGVLHLQTVAPLQVGIVQLTMQPDIVLDSFIVRDLPDGLRPDATIAASVEFVEEEARALQERRQTDSDS